MQHQSCPYVVGIGHCCRDTICTVEAYPPEDGSTHILSMDDSQGGGAVATALVAAARLGARAEVIANLGTDATGDAIAAEFCALGVGTEGIRRVTGGRSSVSYVMVDSERGTRTKFPYRDNLPPIVFDEQRRRLIEGAAVLHLDGTQYENALSAARIAKKAGVPVSLDGCSMQQDNARNLALAAMADILIMNARYPLRVSGQTDLEKALRAMAALGGAKVVVTTRGAEGCWALIDGGLRHFPAFPVRTVDTTGAGDVFHGAFLTAWLEGRGIEDSIRFASAVAALKCTRYGGRAGIPAREAAEAFLAAQSKGAS